MGRVDDYIANFLQKYLPKEEKTEKPVEKVQIEEKKITEPSLEALGTPSMFSSEQMGDPNAREQLAAYEGWVYACVRKIATTSAGVDLKLFEKRSSGVEEVMQHDVIDLLQRANDFMTYYDLIELTATFMELVGEAYWWKVRDERGQVVELFPWLSPDRMKIIPGKEKFIAGYVYQIPETGLEVPFDAEDIVYFRFPDPMKKFRGASPVRAASLDIATEEKARKWNWRFFQNSAQPHMALETEHKIDQDAFDRLKVQFENNHRGEVNAYKLAILPQGTKLNPIGSTHMDMDFMNQRTFSRDSILAMYGVPKAVLGLVEDVNRANADASKRIFLEETITPFMKKIVGTINEQLIAVDFQDNLFFDFDDLTPEDQDQKLALYSEGLKDGWLTRNEVRLTEGFTEVAGADSLLVPFNLVEVGSSTVPETEEGEKMIRKREFNMQKKYRTEYDLIEEEVVKTLQKRKKKTEKKIKKVVEEKAPKKKSPACRMSDETQGACVNRKIPEIMKEDPTLEQSQAAAIAISTCKKPCESKDQKKKGSFSDESKLKIWEIREKQIRRETPTFTKKLKKLFNDQEKRALAGFEGKKFARTDIEDIQLDPDEESEIFTSILLLSFIGVAVRNGNQTAQLFNLPVTLDETDPVGFLTRSINKFAKETTKDTNSAVAKSLGEGIKEGDSLPKLRERVSEIFTHADKVRAERIARSELTRVTTWANERIYKDAGIEFKEWFTNPGACQWCIPMQGKVIPISGKYWSLGDEVVGNEGGLLPVSYTTIERPPLHPNCVTGDTKFVSPDATKITRFKYSGDIFKLLFADGTELSVTPNHMLLTSNGWRTANRLRKGDNILKSSNIKGIVTGNPDDYNSPASIEEIFSALLVSEGVTARSMPVTTENFHGDGEFGQGEIDVISSDGLLRDNLESSFLKKFSNFNLNRRNTKSLNFSGPSDLFSVLVALNLAADGIMSGSSILSVINDSAIAHHQSIRLRDTANYNTRFSKATSNSSSINTKAISEALQGMSRIIESAKLVSIEVLPFHNYVYDIESLSTSYIANSIVSSNCRCDLLPVVPGFS